MKHPRAQLPDYAVGALPPGQQAEVEAHLAWCSSCQAEVRQFDQVFVGWTDALPEVVPADQLKTKLFERITRERRTEGEATLVTEAEPQPPPSVVVHRSLSTASWLMAACAVCLMIAGVGFYQSTRSQLAYELLRTEQELVTRFLALPEVRTISLFDSDDQGIGTALLGPQDEALFVLARPPPAERVYQAWGHVNDDWNPRSGEQLTSLNVSPGTVFEVSTAGFAALYLSSEPVGGSPQPTDPVSKVSLGVPAGDDSIEVLSPSDGAVLSTNRAIIRGSLSSDVRELEYRVNDGELVAATSSGGRFIFTVSGLRRGQNRLELLATDVRGATSAKALTLSYRPVP